MLCILVFTFCGAVGTQGGEICPANLIFDVITEEKPTLGDYSVFILLALKEVCVCFFFNCEIIPSFDHLIG